MLSVNDPNNPPTHRFSAVLCRLSYPSQGRMRLDDSRMIEHTFQTDPTGRWFVSYRRSRLSEIERLVARLHKVGVPTWQDRTNLASEQTVEAIAESLESAETAGAIIWLSKDVALSPIILQEEAPRILKRARARNGFAAELCLADGIGYDEASGILEMPASLEDTSAVWNLRCVSENPASDSDIDSVACTVLARRVAAVHRFLPQGEPFPISIYAHARAHPTFVLGCGLLVDWTHCFNGRHAPAEMWPSRLLPALDDIVAAVRIHAPRRSIMAEGFMSIATAVALGRALMEPSGIPFAWKQLPRGQVWSLAASSEDSGFDVESRSQVVSATDLALLVSVRGNVEAAVVASKGSLPPFRAIVHVRPRTDQPTVDLVEAGQAAHVARLVGNALRDARHKYPAIKRTHLFYSGPVGVAAMIGQQLNAVGPVQTYEHQQTSDDGIGRFVPAALLCDQSTTLR